VVAFGLGILEILWKINLTRFLEFARIIWNANGYEPAQFDHLYPKYK